jgi:hypothetical protein
MNLKETLLRNLILEINTALKAESSEEVIRNLNVPKKTQLISGIQLAKKDAGEKPVTYVRDVGDRYIYAAIGGTQDLANFEPEYYICIYDNMRPDRNTYGKKFLPGAEGYKPSSLKDFYSVNPAEINKLSKPVRSAVIGSAIGLKQAYGTMNTYQYITQNVRDKVLPAAESVAQTPPPIETSPIPPAAGASDPAATDAIIKDAVIEAGDTGEGEVGGSPVVKTGGGSSPSSSGGSPGSSGGSGGTGGPDGTGTAPSEEGSDDDDAGPDDGSSPPGVKPGKQRKPRRKWLLPSIPFIPSLELFFGFGGGGGGGRKPRGRDDQEAEESTGRAAAKGRDTTPEEATRIVKKELNPFVREYLRLSPAEKDLLIAAQERRTTGVTNPSKVLEIVKNIPSARSRRGNIYSSFITNNPLNNPGDKEDLRDALRQFKKLGIDGREIIKQASMAARSDSYIKPANNIGWAEFDVFYPGEFRTLAIIMDAYSGTENLRKYPDELIREIARIYSFTPGEVRADIDRIALERRQPF